MKAIKTLKKVGTLVHGIPKRVSLITMMTIRLKNISKRMIKMLMKAIKTLKKVGTLVHGIPKMVSLAIK